MCLVLLLIAQAGATITQVTYLTCTLPDIHGDPIVWGIKLNEGAGTVQIVREGSVLNKIAIFAPQSVIFELFGATIEINRVDGTVKQTPNGEDGRSAGKGRCVVSNVKRAF
jgi:hypothetical protein